MSEQFTGYVKIKDGNKGPLDYSPNREVEVSISFSTDQRGDLDAITREAAKVADDVVNEKLGRSAAAETTKVTQTKKAKPPTPPKQEKPAEEKKQTAPAADPAAMGEPTVIPATGSGQAISTGEERVDPNAKKDPAGMDDVLAPVAPSQITDSHLMSAITRRNAETSNAMAIRALIGKYVPQDGNHHGAADIEQGKRQAFLLELDKVQKANG